MTDSREVGMEIEHGPNGVTDESIEKLRRYYEEHGELPPEYEQTLVERTVETPGD